jgi:hypothetical protein
VASLSVVITCGSGVLIPGGGGSSTDLDKEGRYSLIQSASGMHDEIVNGITLQVNSVLLVSIMTVACIIATLSW